MESEYCNSPFSVTSQSFLFSEKEKNPANAATTKTMTSNDNTALRFI
jgi:hypothetical protein